MGRSGCGKGTQAKLLIEELERRDLSTGSRQAHPVLYIETGARFRELLARDTFTSTLSRQIMDAGKLQPAFLAIHNWSHYFIDGITGSEHLIIDGTPRRLNEARILAEALKFYGRQDITVFNLVVSPDWVKERLAIRSRADDALANVEQRLKWFDDQVAPAIEYFRDEGSLRVVDVRGEQSIENVKNEIFSKIFTAD